MPGRIHYRYDFNIFEQPEKSIAALGLMLSPNDVGGSMRPKAAMVGTVKRPSYWESRLGK